MREDVFTPTSSAVFSRPPRSLAGSRGSGGTFSLVLLTELGSCFRVCLVPRADRLNLSSRAERAPQGGFLVRGLQVSVTRLHMPGRQTLGLSSDLATSLRKSPTRRAERKKKKRKKIISSLT